MYVMYIVPLVDPKRHQSQSSITPSRRRCAARKAPLLRWRRPLGPRAAASVRRRHRPTRPCTWSHGSSSRGNGGEFSGEKRWENEKWKAREALKRWERSRKTMEDVGIYRFWFISQSRMYPRCGNDSWFMINCWLYGVEYISNNLNDYWVFKVSGCSRYIVWCVLGFAIHAYVCKGVVIVDLRDPGSKTSKVPFPWID